MLSFILSSFFFWNNELGVHYVKPTSVKSEYIEKEEYFFNDDVDRDEYEELVPVASSTFVAESFEALKYDDS